MSKLANWGRIEPTDAGRQAFKVRRTYQDVIGAGEEPYLVPPTWKKIVGGPLEHVWSEAVSRLGTATRIVVVGYSIPATDLHFKYLMAAGLQNNVSLRQILFVNPDADNQVRKRAEDLLRKSYLTFSNLTLSGFTASRPPVPCFTSSNPQMDTAPEIRVDDMGRQFEQNLTIDLQ